MAKTKKTVIVLGDSFIYGHGCKDRIFHVDTNTGELVGDPKALIKPPSEYAWPELLRKDHSDKVDVYNLSLPGIDPQSLISSLANLLDGTDIVPDMIIWNSIPGGRLLLTGGATDLGGTPFLNRLIDIHAYGKKSGNWAVFRQSLPLGVANAVSGGSGALTDEQNEAFRNFAALLYHDGLGVQMAVSAMLAAYAVALSYNAKFVWAAASHCPAALNQKGVIPKVILDQLKPSTIKHIADFQRNDPKRYNAPDLHSNEQCREDYYRNIIKPKLVELFK